jgi:hypothetical protein
MHTWGSSMILRLTLDAHRVILLRNNIAGVRTNTGLYSANASFDLHTTSYLTILACNGLLCV